MHEDIREVLRKAYQIEVDGYTFYSMAADRSTKPAVGELFAKLAGTGSSTRATSLRAWARWTPAAWRLSPSTAAIPT